MKVGFIGAGKVGTAMGIFFNSKGFDVLGYNSRSNKSAEIAASYIGGNVFYNIYDLAIEADIIAIASPDDAIEQIVTKLSGLKLDWANKAIFHTSGVNSSRLLQPLYEKGGTVFSLHPMLAFNIDPSKAASDLEEIFFTVEGRGQIDHYIEYFKRIGIKLVEISAEDKVLYHASATMVSNYLVALMDIGINMLVDIGFTKEAATDILEPLIRNNINNVIELGSEKALTGPIARGDIGTIEKHLAGLKNYNELILDIYRSLGRQTVDLAKRAEKIEDGVIVKLKEAFKNE